MVKSDWRTRAEGKFEYFSDAVFDNKFKVLSAVLLMVIALAINLPKITFDTSTEGFLYEDEAVPPIWNVLRVS